MWIGARDWRFGVAVVGTASTWIPWFLYACRPIFSFYSVITLPFLVLALVLGIGRLLGSTTAPTTRRTVGVVVAGSYFVLVLMNSAWFWPIYTDGFLTHAQWLQRIRRPLDLTTSNISTATSRRPPRPDLHQALTRASGSLRCT